MIDIKIFRKKKNNASASTSSSTSSSSSQQVISTTNDWFFFDDDNNAVACKYDFYSLGNVAANGQASTAAASFTPAQLDALIALADKTDVVNGNVIIDATIQQRTP